MILYFASLICAIIIFCMSILHFFLLIGLPIGEYVLGGKDKIIPKQKRFINAIFMMIFILLGVFYLLQGKIIPININQIFAKIVMFAVCLFLGYAIIGNMFFTQSKKEKTVMIPLSILGFVSAVLTLIYSW